MLGYKIIKMKIYKNENTPLYNGYVITELPNKKWKQMIISYSPLLLLIPFFLIPFSIIFLFISIYILSTIFKFQNKWRWIALPSLSDLDFYKTFDYQQYLYSKMLDKYYHYRIDNILAIKIKQNCLMSYQAFKKINEKK